MKTPKCIAAIVIATLGLAWEAKASLIDLGLIQPFPSSAIGSPQQEADFIETYLGLSYQLDPTVLAGLNNPGGSASSFQLSWNLTGTGFQLNYVLVKDGTVSGTDNQYLYRLYQVSADQLFASGSPQTVMIDQDNNGSPDKGISHITFLGSPGASVPEGGTTVILLGTALAGLAVMRRFVNGLSDRGFVVASKGSLPPSR